VIKEQGVAGDSMPKEVRDALGGIREAAKDLPPLKAALDAMPFDIVETGPHTVFVVSYKSEIKQKLGTKFFTDKNGREIKPFLLSSALVRIDGGSMYFWDMDGASYSPHLDKIILPDLSGFGSAESREILNQAGEYVKNNETSGGFSGMFGYLDKAEKVITDGFLLH
jgi:hypothetical protein